MDNPPEKAAEPQPDPERYELPIVLIAFGLYAAERCALFALLQGRSASADGRESQMLAFLFGTPPHSILDILLGFDFTGNFPDWFLPLNFALVVVQIVHFGLNYWLIKIPVLLLCKLLNRKKE